MRPGRHDLLVVVDPCRDHTVAVVRDQYLAGRAQFLEKLAALPRIFVSDEFRDRLEESARMNLKRALSRVTG